MDGKLLPHNQLSWPEKIGLAAVLAPTPLVLSWTLASSYFTPEGRARAAKKSLFGGATSWMFSKLNRRQIRGLLGDTGDAYAAYLKAMKMAPIVDELGEHAKLLWVSPRKEERVILYLHGGAFLFGCLITAPSYFKYVQNNLSRRNKGADVAILNYTLVPDAIFPTQLTQAILAIDHLIKSGVKPENIQLVGDSSGGLLLHELLSHMLHPLPGVPKLEPSGPLGGAYFMSPWTCLIDSPLVRSNLGKGDMLDLNGGLYWGRKVLEGVDNSARPYINPVEAPQDWLQGVDTVVKRIMISAGDSEILRDAIIDYKQRVEPYHSDVTFFMEDHGLHCDPFILFSADDKDQGSLTPAIINWLEEGFSA